MFGIQGGIPSQDGEITSKSLTEETIFDHIRKKSKNFPAFSVLKNLEAEALLNTKYHSDNISKDNNHNEVLRDNLIIPVVDRDAGATTAGTKVSNTDTELSSTKMLSFDISMIKNSTQFGETGSSMEVSGKQKCSPSESGRQCSPLALTGKTREVDSFLGFKSVFSFL